jgi:hypothetical protein
VGQLHGDGKPFGRAEVGGVAHVVEEAVIEQRQVPVTSETGKQHRDGVTTGTGIEDVCHDAVIPAANTEEQNS